MMYILRVPFRAMSVECDYLSSHLSSLTKDLGGLLDTRQCRTLMVFQPAEARMIDISFPSRFVRVTYFVHNDKEGRIPPSGARMISKHFALFLDRPTQISSCATPFCSLKWSKHEIGNVNTGCQPGPSSQLKEA